ncbi:MAG: flagellar basal body-associated FliL family protein [Proteobacteria bacterium]|nr:flagellar basal body-associated FliL family protein [Pseudomonadota bacterium]
MADNTGNNKPMTQEEIEALLEGDGKGKAASDKKSDRPNESGRDIVSADDIDKIFESVQKGNIPDVLPLPEAVDDGADILSPAEIDKLMNASSKGKAQNTSPEPEAMDDGSSIMSPEDIDKLLDFSQKAPIPEPVSSDTVGEDEDSSLVSPEELAQIMAMASSGRQGKIEEKMGGRSGGPAPELLSSDEIDRLIDDTRIKNTEETGQSTRASKENVSVVSADDIDELFNAAPIDKIITPTLGARDTALDDDLVLVHPDDIERIINGDFKKPDRPADDRDKGMAEDVSDVLSQDDIEKLMNDEETPAASAEDSFSVEADKGDIDQLLNDVDISSNRSQKDSSEPRGADTDDASFSQNDPGIKAGEKANSDNLISQEDIEDLLNGDLPQADPFAKSSDDEDMMDVSQDDIDNLLQSALEEVDAVSVLGDDDLLADSDLRLISQDDIDELLSETLDSDEDIGLVTQDDIDDLLSGLPDKPKPKKETAAPAPEKNVENVETVEEKEKVDIPEDENSDSDQGDEEEQESLFISQDTIDELMKEADSQEKTSEVIIADANDTETELELEPDSLSQDTLDTLLESDPGEDDTGKEPEAESNDDLDFEGLVSQDEIDALLSSTGEESEKVSGEEDEDTGLISQDDINDLLSKADKEPEEDQDEPSLISQDDIDQLLAIEDSDEKKETSDDSPKQEDDSEDVSQDVIDKLLEEETEDSDGDAGLVTQDIIDQLLNEEVDEDEQVEAEEKDQVILEEVEENEETILVDEKQKWYLSKLLWSVTAGVLTLFVSVITIILQEPPVTSTGAGPQILNFTIIPEVSETKPEIKEEIVMVSRDFNGFVVMAPSGRKDIVYVEADVTVDLSEDSANQVQQFEPYFRNIIYDVLTEAMKTQDRLTMKKSDLQNSIKSALNGALADKSIEKVIFTRFALI